MPDVSFGPEVSFFFLFHVFFILTNLLLLYLSIIYLLKRQRGLGWTGTTLGKTFLVLFVFSLTFSIQYSLLVLIVSFFIFIYYPFFKARERAGMDGDEQNRPKRCWMRRLGFK
jgi:hypothetical protein